MTKFVPAENQYLTISLPGELLRAIILSVVNIDTVIVEIVTEPLGKSHNYKYRDVVVCKRMRGMFGEDWAVKPKTNVPLDALIRQEQEEAAEAAKRAKAVSKKKPEKIVVPFKKPKKKVKKNG